MPRSRPTWRTDGDELIDRAIDAFNDWRDTDLRGVRHLLRLDASLGALAFDAMLRALEAVRSGDHLRATTCLVEAEQLGARANEPRLALELGLATGYVLLTFGEPFDAAGALDHVWATAPDDPRLRRRAAGLLAEAAAQLGEAEETDWWWRQALLCAGACGPAAEATVLQGMAHVALRNAAASGVGAEREALACGALAAVDAAVERQARAGLEASDRDRRRSRLLAGEALLLLGRTTEGRDALAEVVATGRDAALGVDDLRPRAHLLLLEVELERGDLVAAARHGERGVASCGDQRLETTLALLASRSAAVHERAGDAVAALRCRRVAADVEARRARRHADPDALAVERQRHDALRGARAARWHGAVRLAATLDPLTSSPHDPTTSPA